MKLLDKEECYTKIFNPFADNEIAKSYLYINGVKSEDFINGEVLEACVSFEDFFITFSIDGDYYEDSLWINFIDGNLRILEGLSLTWPYAGGGFKLRDLEDESSILFEYFGNLYRMRLFGSPQLRIPIICGVPEVRRDFKFLTYMKIEVVKRNI